MNTITTSSPVGRAILGRKVGDEVMAHAPAGEIRFKVVSISK